MLMAVLGAWQLAGCEGLEMPRLKPLSPDDEDYTILLWVLSDPQTHPTDAKQLKESIERQTGWENIFIVNKTNHSALYWGKYRTPKAAQANLKLAKSYHTSAGIPLFAKSIIMPLPGKQIGPGEWNLANATGKHTVIVAVFYNVSEADYVGRKRFAVQYCKQLRDEGFEAYYRHGPAKSFITIGAFGASAVEKVTEGKKTRIIIHEQRIKEIMKRFPFLAVNGRKQYVVKFDPKTRRQKRVASRSYPDLIHPKKGTNAEEAFNRTGDAESR